MVPIFDVEREVEEGEILGSLVGSTSRVVVGGFWGNVEGTVVFVGTQGWVNSISIYSR